MLSTRRHKTVSKSFEDMTFKEQNHAMNRNALQFRRQLMMHLHKAKADGHCTKTLLDRRARLMGRVLDNLKKTVAAH